MAGADVLPYDYIAYAHAISSYLDAARKRAEEAHLAALDFGSAERASAGFLTAAEHAYALQAAGTGDPTRLNAALRATENDLLNPAGLPDRPWYRHTIYAPGKYTGYAAVVLPGVSEAIQAHDAAQAAQQLTVLTQALDRAAQTLEAAP
jgi:N-acetylated-alpha-linked acidic dipeptidase